MGKNENICLFTAIAVNMSNFRGSFSDSDSSDSEDDLQQKLSDYTYKQKETVKKMQAQIDLLTKQLEQVRTSTTANIDTVLNQGRKEGWSLSINDKLTTIRDNVHMFCSICGKSLMDTDDKIRFTRNDGVVTWTCAHNDCFMPYTQSSKINEFTNLGGSVYRFSDGMEQKIRSLEERRASKKVQVSAREANLAKLEQDLKNLPPASWREFLADPRIATYITEFVPKKNGYTPMEVKGELWKKIKKQ